jgi:hypothetical protein
MDSTEACQQTEVEIRDYTVRFIVAVIGLGNFTQR